MQALSHVLNRLRTGTTINKPSAFFTQALLNAKNGFTPAKHTNSASPHAAMGVCSSAIHLLGVLRKEGLPKHEPDGDCLQYLATAEPGLQTQVRLRVYFTGFLVCFC